jgi:hypothetical protein
VAVSEVKRPLRNRFGSETVTNQSRRFEVGPFVPQDLRRRTEIIPVKETHTRIKPLALASGHGRFITVAVTPERTLVSVGEWPLHIAVMAGLDMINKKSALPPGVGKGGS